MNTGEETLVYHGKAKLNNELGELLTGRKRRTKKKKFMRKVKPRCKGRLF